MNCPRCAEAITKPGRFCVGCSYDFGEQFFLNIDYYFGLKEEFARVASLQDNLALGLENLMQRIESYEETLRGYLESSTTATPTKVEPAPELIPESDAVVEKEHAAALEGVLAYRKASKPDSSSFEINVGQKWLLVLGILTMVFGVGYFLKYSFEQGWIGPEGRVAMAYLWGIAFLVAGDRFRRRVERFGLSLIGGGIAVLYFSAFAAFQVYRLFGQTTSFSIMVLITVLACALAIRYDTKWLAVLGLIGGFLTPALLSTGRDNQIALMIYMSILNLGLLGIAFYKKWELLNTLGFIFTYLLYTGWYLQHFAAAKFWPAVFFLNLFFLIYSFVPFTYQVRKGGRSDGIEIGIMGINSVVAFAYGYIMIKVVYGLPWVSVIAVFYACVFLSLATYLYKTGKHTLNVFVIMLAKAMLFLVITVPVLFSKHWITIFWSAQCLAVAWMAVRLDRRSLVGGGYALLLVSVLKFLLYDYLFVFDLKTDRGFMIGEGYSYLIIERYMTTILLIAVIAVSRILIEKAPLGVHLSKKGDGPHLSVLLGIVSFIVLSVETLAFFYDYLLQARFAAISVVWTLFSVVLMLLGFRKSNAVLRKISFGLFLVVVLKVFLFDMSNFSTPYRIISFIILGVVLICTSYLYYRHKDQIIGVLAEADKAGGRE